MNKYRDKYKYLLLSIVIIIFDQITKYLIRSSYSVFDQDEVIKGFFRIVYARNNGAVWGLLSGHKNPFITILITIGAIAALITVIILFFRSKNISKTEMTALAFISGGAIGNIIDRVSLGYVVDFIEIYIKQYRWPAFNVADSFISIGMVLLIFSIFKSGKKQLSIKGD